MRFARLATVIVSLLIPCAAFSQSNNAAITGVIEDPAKAVIPGVSVTAINTKTGERITSKTNGSGQYAIPALTPGTYRIEVDKEGFRGIIEGGLILHTQDIVQLNFHMALGSSSETVTVNADTNNINTTNAEVGMVVDRNFVQEMPLNGRSFQDLMLLTPGANYATPQGGASMGEISVNGQRTDGNSVSVDGASGSNQAAPVSGSGSAGMIQSMSALGTTQSTISVDAMQEFKIATSTYSAEFGRQPGAQVNITSRAGTNSYHGTLSEYLRNAIFDGNDWFNTYAAKVVAKPQEKQNDFGGTFGGPLSIPHLWSAKDRAFFFFAYEGLRLVSPTSSLIYYVPSNGTYNTATYTNPLYKNLRANTQDPVARSFLNAMPLPNCDTSIQPQCVDKGDGFSPFLRPSLPSHSQFNSVSARIDYQFKPWLRLFARYADNPSASSAPAGVGPYIQANQYRTRTFLLGADSVVAENITNELRLQYSPAQYRTVSYYDPAIAKPFDLWGLSGMPAGGYFVTSFRMPSSGTMAIYQVSFGSLQFQPNAVDTITWNHGNHLFKAGADFRQTTARYGDGQYSKGPEAYYVWTTADQILSNQLNQVLTDVYDRQDVTNKNLGLFIQDEWRLHPRITLSLGLRWDFAPPPSVSGGTYYTYTGDVSNPSTLALSRPNAPLYKTVYSDFAPRLGIAVKLHDEPGHELVLRGGAGLYYSLVGNYGAFGNGTTLGSGETYTYTQATPIKATFPLTQSEIELPIKPPSAPYSIQLTPANNLHPPSSIQWSVALEQALGSRQSFTMSYVGSAGRDLVLFKEYNVSSQTNKLFSTLQLYENGPGSSYNSLQLKFQRQMFHGLQALASYTWAHALDSASTELYTYYLPLQKGNSNQDIRHNFSTALVYTVPGGYTNRFERAILANWTTALRVAARTGFPVSPSGATVTDLSSGYEYTTRLNYNGGNPYVYKKGIPGGRQFNPATFSVPVAGQTGNAPRNFLRGFGFGQADLAIDRNFPIYERARLQFRAEAFNVLNHPSFGPLNVGCGTTTAGTTCNNTLFGQATSSLANTAYGAASINLSSLYQNGGPRSMQLALKLEF